MILRDPSLPYPEHDIICKQIKEEIKERGEEGEGERRGREGEGRRREFYETFEKNSITHLKVKEEEFLKG